MAFDLAYVNNTSLPSHFRYRPYIPTKRITVTPTASAVVTQRSDPSIVHGEGYINWTCRACNVNEFMLFYELYESDEIVEFVGYWGEELLVRFVKLDEPVVFNRRFDLSGQMQVLCVQRPYLPRC